MNISTVYRTQRARVSGLGARIIDVTPGSGVPEFSFNFDLWERFKVATEFNGGIITSEWWVTFELAMWQLASRYPIAWQLLQASEELVLTDNCPRADLRHPRAVTAAIMARIVQATGKRTVTLGMDYSDAEDLRKVKGPRPRKQVTARCG